MKSINRKLIKKKKLERILWFNYISNIQFFSGGFYLFY